MQNFKKLRILVFVIATVTAVTSIVSLQSQGQEKTYLPLEEQKKISEQERWLEDFKSQFSVTDYDAPEGSTSKERAERILTVSYTHLTLPTKRIV